MSGQFKTSIPFQSIQHHKKPHYRDFDDPNWPTGAKDIDILVFQNGFWRPF